MQRIVKLLLSSTGYNQDIRTGLKTDAAFTVYIRRKEEFPGILLNGNHRRLVFCKLYVYYLILFLT